MTERRRHAKILKRFAELFDLTRRARPAETGVLGDSIDKREPGSTHNNGAIGGRCMRFTTNTA